MTSMPHPGSPARLSIVQYLSVSDSRDTAICDKDQIDALSTLSQERRNQALSVLANGLKPHYTGMARQRLIHVMREMRGEKRLPGAAFLLGLLAGLEGETTLLARETALQSMAEGDHIRTLEHWGDAFSRFEDPLAPANIAHLVPEFAKLKSPEIDSALTKFIEALANSAPAIAHKSALLPELNAGLDRLSAALTQAGYFQDARNVGRISVDVMLNHGLSI